LPRQIGTTGNFAAFTKTACLAGRLDRDSPIERYGTPQASLVPAVPGCVTLGSATCTTFAQTKCARPIAKTIGAQFLTFVQAIDRDVPSRLANTIARRPLNSWASAIGPSGQKLPSQTERIDPLGTK
jgi:hypothetical protein